MYRAGRRFWVPSALAVAAAVLAAPLGPLPSLRAHVLMRISTVLTAVLVLAGCGSDASTVAQTQDTPISSMTVHPPVVAPAGLTAFPDFNEFAPADINRYEGTNSHRDRFVTFSTVDEVSCFAYFFGSDALGSIECDSDAMPGFPANAAGGELRKNAPAGTHFAQSVTQAATAGTFEFRITRNHVRGAKQLPVGQRITLGDSGCAAGDGVLACIDSTRHGFVVAATGSWAF